METQTIIVFFRVGQFLRRESGQGMLEYCLILALMALLVIGALTVMGVSLNDIFVKIMGEAASVSSSISSN